LDVVFFTNFFGQLKKIAELNQVLLWWIAGAQYR